jgi:hypothetical protein
MAGTWQSSFVTLEDPEWLTVPDLVELLGLPQSRVRRLIEDRQLVAVRRDGILVVPALFVRDGEPVAELRGTLHLLFDSVFTDEEAV